MSRTGVGVRALGELPDARRARANALFQYLPAADLNGHAHRDRAHYPGDGRPQWAVWGARHGRDAACAIRTRRRLGDSRRYGGVAYTAADDAREGAGGACRPALETRPPRRPERKERARILGVGLVHNGRSTNVVLLSEAQNPFMIRSLY